MRHIMHSSDRQKNMAWIQGSRCAGASGRCLDTFVIQEQKQGFTLDSLKTEVHISGKPAFRVSVQRGVRDLPETVDQAVAHFRQMGPVLLHLFGRFPKGLSHRRDAGHIFRSGALSALLCPAFDQVRQAHALLREQEPDAFRAVELMPGGRQQIDIVIPDVHRDMPDCLDRVRMEEHLLLPAYGSDLPYGLDRTDLIVRVHDRHQAGVIPDGGRDFFRADDPVLMDVQKSNVEYICSI